MKIEVASEVFAAFPGYVRHVLVVEGADNTKEVPELAGLLADAQRSVRGNGAFEDPKAYPFIASWRDGYTAPLAAATGRSEEAVRADFDAMVEAILTPPLYAIWHVPIVSAQRVV